MAKFSDMLGYLRKREGISQQELADKLKISRSAIGMYESGSRTPDLETLEAMADLFNVNIDTLLGKNSTNSVVPTDLLQIDTRLNKLGHQEWTRYGEYLARQKVYQKESGLPNFFIWFSVVLDGFREKLRTFSIELFVTTTQNLCGLLTNY